MSNEGGTDGNDDFGIFGALGELMAMIKHHMDFMAEQEASVDEYIAKSGGSSAILTAAKLKALETETDLMNQIMNNIEGLSEFLNNIILIENLFNAQFDADQRKRQKQARQKYAPNIQKYETKPKPISDVSSFVDLMFAGVSVYLKTFGNWLDTVESKCKDKGIKMVSNSGAKAKNIERAFYKSFYVYAIDHGDNAFQQMTDVLRCSLVFDDFNDVYKCFTVIEELANDDEKSEGILRVKDRFDPDAMPFGYRDMLINLYCPGSKVVCEVQLHHVLFYKYKKISHRMYKKARLFEQGEENLAYLYADRRVRKKIGDKVYEPKNEELGADDDDDDELDESVFQKHDLEMTLKEAFDKYKGGLSKFLKKFNEDGYGDGDEPIHEFIEDLPLFDVIEDFNPSSKESCKEEREELEEWGMKGGHLKKYKKMLIELKGKRTEFKKLQEKREKMKKKKAEQQEQKAKQAETKPAQQVQTALAAHRQHQSVQQQLRRTVPVARSEPANNANNRSIATKQNTNKPKSNTRPKQMDLRSTQADRKMARILGATLAKKKNRDTTAGDPKYAKYNKMKKIGMPMESIKNKMKMDGFNDTDIAKFSGSGANPPSSNVGASLSKKKNRDKAVTEKPAAAAGGDPKYAKYNKMKKIGMPMESIKNKMKMDGFNDTDIAKFSGSGANPPSSNGVDFSKYDLSKYDKMKRMGMPEGSIRNAMRMAWVDKNVIAAYFGDASSNNKPAMAPPPAPPIPSFSGGKSANSNGIDLAKHDLRKYDKMKKMRMPEASVRNAMRMDGIDQNVIAAYFGEVASNDNKGMKPPPAPPIGGKPNLDKYSKMRKMGMPEMSIRHKMTKDGISEYWIDDFFASQSTVPPPVPSVGRKPDLSKYSKMKKIGMPTMSIKNKMKMDGIAEHWIRDFFR